MKVVLIVCTVLADLFVAVSPFLPFTAAIWVTTQPSVFYARLAAMVGVLLTLNTATTLLLLRAEFADLGRWRDQLLGKLPDISIKQIADTEFYSQFLAACREAKHNVDICYFAPEPPAHVAPPYRTTYYRGLHDAISTNTRAAFRRIVRRSPHNEEWVAELVRELRGRHHVSIALLDDLSKEAQMGLALSVQRVDDDHTWLLALSAHEKTGQYRDVYVHDRAFSDAMGRYFNRLWTAAVLVMEHGNVTDAGDALLTELSEHD